MILRKLNLPLLVSYLLTGIAMAALVSFKFSESSVSVLPELGSAFALFLIGMELSVREVKSFGRAIAISCLIQIVISAIAGVTIARSFGFSGVESFYLGVGLSFSSTVVVVKLLLERRDLKSLYGKLSVGILLLEDLVALLVLMFLSGSGQQFHGLRSLFLGSNSLLLSVVAAKTLILLLLTYLFASFILGSIFKSVAKSPELLFILALAWCFLFTSLSLGLGFSSVIGAFLAGVAIASSQYHYNISSKVKPLRDFFIVLFFVYLGSQVNLATALSHWGIILSFVAYALIMKPLIFLLLFGALGFRKHTIYQAALNLSQISEFSLIILLLGKSFNLVGEDTISIMALSVALSIMASSILITQAKNIYPLVLPVLSFFERKSGFISLEDRFEGEVLEGHVVLIGAGRVGGPILEWLMRSKIPVVVLDFNPVVIEKLKKRGIKVLYGDIADAEVVDSLNLDKALLVISTATDPADSKVLLSELRRRHSSASVVVRADGEEEVADLEKRGADYVMLPETTAADFLVENLKSHWPRISFKSLD